MNSKVPSLLHNVQQNPPEINEILSPSELELCGNRTGALPEPGSDGRTTLMTQVCFACTRCRIFSLVSSRSASAATHRAAGESCCFMRFARVMHLG